MRATGIDPAATGVAARADVEFADGVYVLTRWRAIRPRTRHVECWAGLTPFVAPLHAARSWLVEDAHELVAVEATPPLIRGAQAVVTQAEGAGAIVQAVGAPVLRPLPGNWRKALGLSTAATAQGAWGLATVYRRDAPTWTSRVACTPPPTWASEHVAEAASMAVWAISASR